MSLTAEQIAAQLADIGTDLPQILSEAIQAAANRTIEEVKRGAPVDSGALRDSITARVIDDQYLGISMLDYGWFQNFGVQGTKNTSTTFGVTPLVAEFLPPRNGSNYSFNNDKSMIGGDLAFGVRKSIHQKGLNAKSFINIDNIVDRITELVQENLEI